MNLRITFILAAGVFASAAYGAAPNKEKFNELCWNWIDPPQNITEDVCACIFNKVSTDSTMTPADILNVPVSYWEKPSSSKPSNPTESRLKDIYKSCADDVFRKHGKR